MRGNRERNGETEEEEEERETQREGSRSSDIGCWLVITGPLVAGIA